MQLFDKLVFSKFKEGLGIMDTEYFVTAAAPMNQDVHRWFHAIGIDITEIYGMTEDTGPATIGVPGNAVESFSKKIKGRFNRSTECIKSNWQSWYSNSRN